MFIRIRSLLLFCGLLALSSVGCIEIDRVVSLNPDLSGRTEFRMALNLEPMITMAAQEKGEKPTKAEIDEAMADIAEQMKQKPIQKEQLQSKLPAGITLIDAGQSIEGMRAIVRIVLGFDDVRKLPKVELAEPDAEPGQSNDTLSPFIGLQITQTGQTVTFSVKPLLASDTNPGGAGEGASASNPLGDLGAELAKLFTEPGEGNEMAAMLRMFTSSMRETFRLETPFAIAGTNATKKDAKSVTWEYDLATLMKMTPADRAKLTMDVSLRRR
jgi:hypothetical protein